MAKTDLTDGAQPEDANANQIAKLKAENTKLRADQKRLIAEIESITQQLAQARNAGSRVKVPTIGSKRKSKKGAFIRVFVPDSHGHHIDHAAAKAFLTDLKALQPAEIIWIGDHLDAGAFLAQHFTLGYVAETDSTYEDDVASANAFLDQVAKVCPNAQQTYIAGNHESRIEKWCITAELRNRKDSSFLMQRIGPQAVLNLEKRGIRWVSQGEQYDGLSIRGAIKIGKAIATHGSAHGVNAWRTMLSRWGCSIFFGHIHRQGGFFSRNVTTGTIGAWSVGLLAELQPYYAHTRPTDHTHGYTFQIVQPDGQFLVVQPPIIDGVSCLGTLSQILKGQP